MSAFWRPWPKENELGQGAYRVGSEQAVLRVQLRLYGRGMGDSECLRHMEEEEWMSILKGVLQGWINMARNPKTSILM